MRTADLFVVETETDHFLGTIDTEGDTLIVRSGLRGHPARVPLEEVEALILASVHPLVDEPYPS